jgi:hypothetical protein
VPRPLAHTMPPIPSSASLSRALPTILSSPAISAPASTTTTHLLHARDEATGNDGLNGTGLAILGVLAGTAALGALAYGAWILYWRLRALRPPPVPPKPAELRVYATQANAIAAGWPAAGGWRAPDYEAQRQARRKARSRPDRRSWIPPPPHLSEPGSALAIPPRAASRRL